MLAYILRRLMLVIPTLFGIMVINFFIVQAAPGGPVEQMIAQIQGTAGRRHRALLRQLQRRRDARKSATDIPQRRRRHLSRRARPAARADRAHREDVRLRQAGRRALRADDEELPRLRFRRELLPQQARGRPHHREDAGLDLARPLDDAADLPRLDPARHRQGGARRLALRRVDLDRAHRAATRSRASCSRCCWSCCSPAAATSSGSRCAASSPTTGARSASIDKVLDYFWHMALPIGAMVIGGFATLTFLTKNSFLEEIHKQYVLTARAKGLVERRVLYGHVFRNAMLIVIAGFPGGLHRRAVHRLAADRGDLLARRARPARLRGGAEPRLSGHVRHALLLRPDRPRHGHPGRPHVHRGRSADRLRGAQPDDPAQPAPPRDLPRPAGAA